MTVSIAEIQSVHICSRCAHFDQENLREWAREPLRVRCQHPKAQYRAIENLILGGLSLRTCETMRMDAKLCGTAGTLYRSKS